VLVALAILVGFCPLNTANVTASAAVTVASVEYSTYGFTDDVGGLTVTYFDGIYSRGFCWFTAESNPATELYVAAGDLGENTAFTEGHKVPEANCSSVSATDSGQSYYSHKAHITGLMPGETYSYKVGGNGHYRYGTFTVESSDISKIDIITLTDAQTKNLSLLHVWENTAAQSIGVMQNPDFILYGGDQYDVGGRVNNSSVLAYGAALDTVTGRIGSIPYMAAAGNHDYQVTVNRANINFADSNNPGYYSFDYGFTHFVVLNINGNGDTQSRINAQLSWLPTDLAVARSNANIKWIIVMMHNGPHSTGDHSADTYTPNGAARFTEIFSTYHVDLVIQGHDHTYSKTLPYKWDTAGKTTTYGNTEIVNYNVLTADIGGVSYDINPNGTYYVTTGAAGHRAGPTAGENDGVYANVVVDQNAANGSGLAPVDSKKTYLNNTYKTVVGTCNVGCSIRTTTVNKGDPATCNIDGQMFGTLAITPTTLSYKFYTVEDANVQLLDTLDVMKVSLSDEAAAVLEADPASTGAEAVKSLFQALIDANDSLPEIVAGKLRTLVVSASAAFEADRETVIDNATASDPSQIQLQSVQSSEAKDGKFNLRLIGGTAESKDDVPNVGFFVYKDTGAGFGAANDFKCTKVYTTKVEADASFGIANEKTVAAMNGGKLFALTIKDIAAAGTVRLKVVPYGLTKTNTQILGKAFIVELKDGFVKSVTAE